MANHTSRELIIKSTHRGLRYTDGRLTDVLEAGRYKLPSQSRAWVRRPKVEVVVVDMRERELTIKGQEILTSDKVAVRVSILTQYQVVDPVAAVEKVAAYEDRLYSDVQLAARRSLASMTLDEILTNRNQLSEDILADVQILANGYGVKILRADVKDIVFPGNLQDIMNRVLAARAAQRGAAGRGAYEGGEGGPGGPDPGRDRPRRRHREGGDRSHRCGGPGRGGPARRPGRGGGRANPCRGRCRGAAAAQRERERLRPAPGAAAAAGARVARGPVPQRTGPDLHRFRQAHQRVGRLTKIQLTGQISEFSAISDR